MLYDCGLLPHVTVDIFLYLYHWGLGSLWLYLSVKENETKKKKSHALGVPVAAAKHNCKEKAIAVEQGLVSCCKNPHRFYGNVVSQRGGVVPCVMYVQSAVLVHSSVASFSFWDLVFLPYFKIHSPYFCQTSFCFTPDSLCFCFKEDCAWVRLIATFYCVFILNFGFYLSLSEPLVQCTVLCCHTLWEILHVLYWFVTVCSGFQSNDSDHKQM